MGWLWSTPPSKGGDSSSSSSSTANTTTTTTTIPKPSEPPAPSNSSSSSSSDTNTTTPSQPTTTTAAADSTTDPELAKFLSQIHAELSSPQFTSTSTSTSSPSSTWPDPTTTTTTTSSSPPLLDPLSESLLPTRMSCQQAFDLAFHCNSMGGQWLSVYRTGGVRSCGEHWEQFWFCMRARAYRSPHREEAVREFYRRREVDKYRRPGRPSSTDVWEPRAERLPPGEAFSLPYEPPAASDDEWRRAEMWRRRMVREMLEREEEERRKGRPAE